MRLVTACLALIATVAAADADGFAVKDLTQVADKAKAALGTDFVARAAAERVTLACPACAGAPMVDILIGRQTDGTEQRVRSGETPIAKLEALCRAKSPSCTLDALDVAPAVGWITTYPIGSMTGSTAVMLRDGDLLTIRSLASDERIASSNARTLAKALAPEIVGR